ncbi:major capsid protein [uncultured Sneathiella sp.]|uniref:major capsid protein n=1 Tax=uncultured Sneathiella sp. TaxID=879315 RepID=UPI0030EC42CE|tara:strand:+ start:4485 stop:5486 length:1002 start_codon:yes stop_codon:yes gene_type:complete
MATLGTENPTLADLAKVTDPDGTIADVIEILNQTNEILEDMTWLEGNLTTGHRSSIRSGLPSPTFRKMYGFVQPTKSRAVQITDNCGMMEDYSQVDKALVDMAGNPAAFRLQEDRPHIEGMNQTLATKIFYGDESTSPEEFTGLSPRYNSLSAENGDNIISGGGSGSDNASIWLICWSPNTCHGIIPKGSKAGVQQRDLGEVTVQDTEGGTTGLMQGYRTHYRWDVGLTVRDWRYAVRIANIDRSALLVTAATGADLNDLMHQAVTEIPNTAVGRCAWYMDKSILSMLRRQTSNAVSNSTLSMDMVGGTMQTSWGGYPIRRVDALRGNEATVS